MREPFGGAVGELLMMTFALVKEAKGEKRNALRSAWMRAANGEAMHILNIDEGRLPRSPRAAAEALMRNCIEIAKGCGLDSGDLQDFFNECADSGQLGRAANLDDAITRGFALMCVLGAERISHTVYSDTNERACL
jgi:hypothetical protein